MAKLILVRHGHVEGIDPPRFRGRVDIPLTEEGRRQACAAAEAIAVRWRPAAVYTSPLQRCVRTGSEIAAATGAVASVLDDLIDLDYGAWQGRTTDEVRATWPQLLELWREAPDRVRFPRGESLQELAARIMEVLRKVLERHPHDTVVLVGHDSGLRALLLQLLGLPMAAYRRLAPQPASISEIEVLEQGARVLSFGETQHLRRRPAA